MTNHHRPARSNPRAPAPTAGRVIPGVYLATLAFHVVAIVTSRALYPAPYSFLTHTISDLGSIAGNPRATVLFGLAHLLSGALLLPVLGRLARQIRPPERAPWTTARAWGLGLHALGGVGFVLVGVFPLEMDVLHGVGAACIFGGFVPGIPLLGRACRGENPGGTALQPPSGARALARGGEVVFGAFLAIGGFTGLWLLVPGPVTYTLGEWLSFFLMLGWLAVLAGASFRAP